MLIYQNADNELKYSRFFRGQFTTTAQIGTLCNKIFPSYQPCQLVKRRKTQRCKDHLCPRLERPKTRRGQRLSLNRWVFRRLTN
jgi:hypothetical protein